MLDPFEGLTTYTYDELDRLETRTLPNDVETTWTFDERDRLESIVHRDSGGAVISSFTYEHPDDAVGEPHRITREDGSYVKLFYDPALRLEREEYYEPAGAPGDVGDTLVRKIEYTYDTSGNRTSRTVNVQSQDVYNINSGSGYELDSITGANPATFGYDSGGRLTSVDRATLDAALSYNASGQLTSVDNTTGDDYQYQYDAFGHRTAAATNSTVDRNFLVAPAAQRLGPGALDVAVQHLAADGSGDLLTGWVYAGENPILRFDDAGNVQYYLEDASDSIAALVDATAAPVTEYRYDGFGNNLNAALYDDPASNSGGDFGFHAAWREGATGLYHMRARTYDPETGRFTSPDPVDPSPQVPETFEPYSFANSNPHFYSDPSGLFSITELNASNAIQTGIRALQSSATQYVKNRVIEEVNAAAAQLLANAFVGLLPIPQRLIEAGKKALAGGSFESLLSNGLCGWFGQVIPDEILNQFHFGPRISTRGEPLNDGIGCQQGIFNIPSGGAIAGGTPYANPDYVVKRTPPMDTRDRAWLVGDIKLTVNTLYDAYVDPGDRSNQWDAMANYSKEHGYRIVMFFAFKKLNEQGSELFEEKLLKEGAGQGVVVLVASFDF